MVTSVSQADIEQMRDQVFFEGPDRGRRLSRYWLLLPGVAIAISLVPPLAVADLTLQSGSAGQCARPVADQFGPGR